MAHGGLHALVNLAVYLVWIVATPAEFGLMACFWVVAAGLLFDLEHLVYYGFTTRPLTKAALLERMHYDYEHSVPHFYGCHTIEWVMALGVLALALGSIWRLVFWGWCLHMIVDSIDYLRTYRGLMPWIPFFSWLWYFGKVKKVRD
jgi:hypothetical protein